MRKGIRKYLTSIRFRILFVYVLVVVICFTTVMLISENLLEQTLIGSSTELHTKELERVSAGLDDAFSERDVRAIYETAWELAQSVSGRVLVMNTNYIVIADSASLFNGWYLPYDEAVSVLEGTKTESVGFHRLTSSRDGSTEWMSYLARPILSEGKNAGAVLLSVSVQGVSDTIKNVQRNLWGAFFVLLIVMTAIVFLLVTRSLTPIAKLTDVMRNATAKTFERRVDIKAEGEVKELVDAFNRMGSELNAHDKIRDRFVADASHELKTPLASIKALSESVIYCDNPPPELMLDFLKDINSQVDRLNNIVSDLLAIARDSSNDVQYNMELIDLGSITDELVRFVMPVAEKKGLTLTVNADDKTIIFGDKMRIGRVVTNLVDNALKYTEKGRVDVRVFRDRQDAVLEVRDTGIGIPEDAIPHLFTRFYRVDKARSRATGGTGLGLSMVEEIVARHGGTIKVESRVGEGSTFTVRIPLA